MVIVFGIGMEIAAARHQHPQASCQVFPIVFFNIVVFWVMAFYPQQALGFQVGKVLGCPISGLSINTGCARTGRAPSSRSMEMVLTVSAFSRGI